MGLLVNDSIEHAKMGISVTGCYIRVSEVHIQKTADDKFEVIGMVKIYGDKTARDSNRATFSEYSASVISDGVPASPYDLIFNELRNQYPNSTNVL